MRWESSALALVLEEEGEEVGQSCCPGKVGEAGPWARQIVPWKGRGAEGEGQLQDDALENKPFIIITCGP